MHDAGLVLKCSVNHVGQGTLDNHSCFLLEETYVGLAEVDAPLEEVSLVVVFGQPQDLGVLGVRNDFESWVLKALTEDVVV